MRLRGLVPRCSVGVLLLILPLLQFPLVCGQLRIMSPSFLVERLSSTHARIDGSTATFGAPFYGERLLGKLVYGESRGSHAHCKDDEYDVAPPAKNEVKNHEHVRMPLLHIVIVRRGNCSFVTKVRVAQEKGAHAVIIVDNADSGQTTKELRKVIVADDGSGSNVHIPSVLISAEEGTQLIDAAKGHEPVIAELAWDVPTDHVVMVDLWMSSGSEESNRFLKEFSKQRRALNDALKFVPHYHVFGLQTANYDYNDLCSDTTAEYCAEDPDGAGPVTGRMVLDEDVRQLCIHALYKVSSKLRSGSHDHEIEYSKEYWDYVEQFHDTCSLAVASDSPNHKFGETCSNRLMKKVGIDVSLVEQCVRETGPKKLAEQRHNIAWSPRALRINGWRYMGRLEADLVTRAICAGFVHQPDACKTLVEPTFGVQGVPPAPAGLSLKTLSISVLAVCGIVVAAAWLYKRSLTRQIQSALREEVMLEVQSQMDSYKQLSS